MMRRAALLGIVATVLAGCGGSGDTPPATVVPSEPVSTLLQPTENEGALIDWVVGGARLTSRTGNQIDLAAPAMAAYFGDLAPRATVSPGERFLAYSTGTDAAALRVHLRDLRTGRERMLEPGTTGAAWRADGALAYFRNDGRTGRLRGHLYVRRVTGTRLGTPVRWTRTTGTYFPFGWAGARLVYIGMGEGEYVQSFVADAPGTARKLGDGAPIAISPDGARALVFAGGDGSGRDLLLVDLATGRSNGRLRTAPLTAGDWQRELVVAGGANAVEVLRVHGDRITPVRRIRLGSWHASEPRFVGTRLRRVVVSSAYGDGARARLTACVVATGRCRSSSATTGLDQPHAVFGQSVASPTLPVPADGRHFGFIRSLEDREGTLTAVFDPAQWLTGAAAQRAARADADEVANDYYIHNEDRSTMRLPVAAGATVTIVTPTSMAGRPSTLGHLVRTFSGGRPGGTLRQGPGSAYWLTVRGGTVTSIKEQYRP
ncbi:MAG: hypothetical protein U0Y82_05840 [Thermoleophilia bacterium]